MAGLQNEVQDNKSIPETHRQKISGSEDEIDLADYLRILWKRRYFIFFCSITPALLVGLILFFLPGDYRVAYIYEIEQYYDVLTDRQYSLQEVRELISEAKEIEPDEYGYKVLCERFYSSENMNRLAYRLRQSSSDESSPGLTKANVRLDVSDDLLTLTVIGRTQEEVQKISEIVRDNLEKVIPVYSVNDQLHTSIAALKDRMSEIEKNRFHLQLELDRKRAILTRLKSLSMENSNSIPDGIVLHFNCGHESSEYLPLRYQVQAVDANIVNIEETINMDRAEYDYYETLLSLNDMLVKEIENQMSSYYNIEQYRSFLAALAGHQEENHLEDYVRGYIREIENITSMNTPLVTNPGIDIIPRGNVKKATIVFVALLMITTFAAFLMESAQKGNTQAS